MAAAELKHKPGKTSGQARAAVPPPLVFTAAIIVGVVLDLLVPVDLLPGAAQLVIGLPVIGLSVFLFALSFRSFAKNSTPPGHTQKTAVLITDGLFGYTRNPLYLSGLLLVLGFGILLDSVWIAALIVPAQLIIQHGVVLREEDYLLSRFQEEYKRYKSSVRRWL